MKLVNLIACAAVLLSSTAAISQYDTDNAAGETPQKKYKIAEVSVFFRYKDAVNPYTTERC